MEIILSRNCRSFTGSINKAFGYAIQRRGGRFFAKRNSKGHVPPEGHLRFIYACAEMAADGVFIADIRVPASELADALKEAGIRSVADRLTVSPELYPGVFDASQIRELLSDRGL